MNGSLPSMINPQITAQFYQDLGKILLGVIIVGAFGMATGTS